MYRKTDICLIRTNNIIIVRQNITDNKNSEFQILLPIILFSKVKMKERKDNANAEILLLILLIFLKVT